MTELVEGGRRGVMGRPPLISIEDVVASASALAERVGLARLTMTMVAEDLGVTKTALYHHVAGKQDLLDLVVDAALDRVQAPSPDVGPWDERVRVFERAVRVELRRLRGSGTVFMGTRALRPAEQRLIDIGVEIVGETGVDELEVRLAFTTLFAYMLGQLWLDGVYGGGPTTELETIRAATGGVEFTSDDLFEYGIETVLAGLRLRLEATPPRRRRGGGPRAPR